MTHFIPFLDLKSPYMELKEELDAAYFRVMESGWYILGKNEAFEQEFARKIRYSIALAWKWLGGITPDLTWL
jgi:dTDP-4-amino-4,6-dideoxygalactose transaminase